VVVLELFLKDANMCFGCSQDNPIGLKLEFKLQGDTCRAVFRPDQIHQGWNGYMHGGLISTLLDEAMGQWLWLSKIPGMTAEMTTRFSLGVPIGEEITVEAWCEGQRGRLYELAARVILPDGKVAARAGAKFLRVQAKAE
jgi:acyl-coenzyme A thioesterase PaaI-like protein